jgi:hypothetical protein
MQYMAQGKTVLPCFLAELKTKGVAYAIWWQQMVQLRNAVALHCTVH